MILSEKIYLRVLSLLSLWLGTLYFKYLDVNYGENLTLFNLPIIAKFLGSKIELGNRVVLCSSSRATALGVNHPVVLRTLAPGAKIEIGDDVGISGGSICAGSLVTIGARSMLGANVTISDTDFHDFSQENRRYSGTPQPEKFLPVIIEENVFLGTNVIVLKGVKIGENSVIGAGSVVTHDIPANVIAVGNPCKVIKTIQSFSSVSE